MDEGFYANSRHWATEAELPALVSSLLDGAALEPPFTTALWTQAYAAPGTVPQRVAEASAAVLPTAYLHREVERRTQGFYACVRCTNPICDPAHQVVPAAGGLRGVAVFAALCLDGVELCVLMPSDTRGGTAAAAKAALGRLVRERRTSLTRPRAGLECDRQQEDTGVDGGLRFVLYCRHCSGCLGVMRIGEAVHHVESAVVGARDDAAAAVASQALFCANSVCLEYMPYCTRAPLGQVLDEALSSGAAGGGGDAGLFGGASAADAVSGQAGVTLGELFGQRGRAAAWGLDGDASVGSTTSFDDLLAELDTRRAAAERYSDHSDGDDGE